MSRGFLRTLDGIESVLNLICSFVLFLLMFYVTLEVIMRFFFNSPLSGHLEMSQLLIAAAVFLGLSYAQARRSHVGMDI
ncbi:MAG: TRAP transporter small permease subunit, partial [Chloroflexi bacterium]|nr:TRAP transporter small permease subunit [Chloroflexota bacterium]